VYIKNSEDVAYVYIKNREDVAYVHTSMDALHTMHIFKVGQILIYKLYMAVYLEIPLPKKTYIHRVYV